MVGTRVTGSPLTGEGSLDGSVDEAPRKRRRRVDILAESTPYGMDSFKKKIIFES